MIIIESQNGKIVVKNTKPSNILKSNDGVEEFCQRAQTSPTETDLENMKEEQKNNQIK